jgi:hypothetical protein
MMPQYPGRFPSRYGGSLFYLPKEEILQFLDGQIPGPLKPRDMAFTAPELRKKIPDFGGFEAIAFNGSAVYLSIESRAGSTMKGWFLSGEISPDMSRVIMDPESVRKIPMPVQLRNMGPESLLMAGEDLMAIYEANGEDVNPEPVVHVFEFSPNMTKIMSFPNIEYRITDATVMDRFGRFWVMNFYYWGDAALLRPVPDPIVKEYGTGGTHARFRTVERLLQLQYADNRVVLTDRPPILFKLVDDFHPRNWEGLVRLDERGFLVMTDAYPETLLGFVPWPGNE